MASESMIRKNFLKAKNASTFSDFPRQSLGAVMMLGNKTLAVGWNTVKTNPVQKEYNKYRNFDTDTLNNGTIHAEMMCLLKTRYYELDWSKVSIYIYRQKKDGQVALAKPCKACEKALHERGIKNIYYTTDEFPYEKLAV
jgi:deoxycytidylate deaminase